VRAGRQGTRGQWGELAVSSKDTSSKAGAGRELLRTGEAAKAAGVSRQTLQYYLMVGLIEPSQRTTGGHQLFGTDAIKRIKLIKQLNDSGYTLRDIRDIFLEGK